MNRRDFLAAMFAAAAAPAIVRAESIMRIAPPKILLLDDEVLLPYSMEIRIDQMRGRDYRSASALALQVWATGLFLQAEDRAIMQFLKSNRFVVGDHE